MRLLNAAFVLAPLSVLCLAAPAVPAIAQTEAPRLKTEAPAYISPVSGKQMYVAYCGACHGAQGKGDGPAAAALKVPPTDLTLLMSRNGGKFPESHFRDVIQHGSVAAHGSADMPVWGEIFRALDNDRSASSLRVENLMKYVEVLNYPIH